jgi:hypothetical protein
MRRHPEWGFLFGPRQICVRMARNRRSVHTHRSDRMLCRSDLAGAVVPTGMGQGHVLHRMSAYPGRALRMRKNRNIDDLRRLRPPTETGSCLPARAAASPTHRAGRLICANTYGSGLHAMIARNKRVYYTDAATYSWPRGRNRSNVVRVVASYRRFSHGWAFRPYLRRIATGSSGLLQDVLSATARSLDIQRAGNRGRPRMLSGIR